MGPARLGKDSLSARSCLRPPESARNVHGSIIDRNQAWAVSPAPVHEDTSGKNGQTRKGNPGASQAVRAPAPQSAGAPGGRADQSGAARKPAKSVSYGTARAELEPPVPETLHGGISPANGDGGGGYEPPHRPPADHDAQAQSQPFAMFLELPQRHKCTCSQTVGRGQSLSHCVVFSCDSFQAAFKCDV